MIYFDNGATTRIDDEVLNTYLKVQQNFFANTTSLHKLGQEANFMLEKAKREILDIMNMPNHDVLFTSNATEANNLGIYGVVNNKKGKVITTKIEHPSVYEIFKDLETKGYEVVYLDVDQYGIIDLEQLKNEINKDTLLVSVMWVNNIIGTIEPINEVIKIVQKYPKCRLHVDGVQGICKTLPNFSMSDIDLFTFSTHKIYGPKGVGCLFIKKGLELDRLLHGSESQKGIKPGTLDLGLAVATDKALKKFYPQTQKNQTHVKKINEFIIHQIKNNPAIIINSPYMIDNYSPYILNISIPTINGETIVHYFEEDEIYVSTGSSCSSKLKKPEKTIYNISKNEKYATTAIRISFSHTNTIDEAQKLVSCLNKITGVK